MQASQNENMVRWIDLSAYGIYIGVHTFESGRQKVIMVDESGQHTELARALNLVASKIPNVWFWPHDGKSFSVPASVKLLDRFPAMRVGRIPESTRDAIMRSRIRRMATRMNEPSGENQVPGWRPTQTVKAQEKKPVSMSVDVALKRTLYCGLNAQGQEVLEDSEGSRFIRVDGKVLHREDGVSGGPEFLRAKGLDDKAGLLACARGMLIEMQRTKLRSEDFARYLNAAMGPGSDKNEHRILALQQKIDEAIQEQVSQEYAAEGAEGAFMLAERLQQMRPSFFRPEGSYPTPISISVAVQHILKARMIEDEAEESIVLDLDGGQPARQHSWMFKHSAQGSISPDEHRYFIGGIYSTEVPEQEIDGLRIDRADHLQIINALKSRQDEGSSIFITAADERPGESVCAETRRLIDWVGARYQISGLIDLDPSMVGEGVEKGCRLLVVGPRKEQLDLSFSAPTKIQALFGNEDLWSWSSELAVKGFQDIERYGDQRQNNHLQVPYIAHSMVGESRSMSPRNLLAPTRHALSRLVERVGKNVDDFVSEKLALDQEHMSKVFSAEQIDAIAMGIDAIDRQGAFIIADQAGLGKGRILAALCAYSVMQGKKTLFMTEKSGLYADFYRDARDIGLDHVLSKPFLMNTSGSVRTMDGMDIIHPSSDPVEIERLCHSGKFPQDHDFMLATYSVFNRDPADWHHLETIEQIERAEEALLEGAAFDDAPNIHRLLDLGNENGPYRTKLAGLQDQALEDALKAIAAYSFDPAVQMVRAHPDEHVSMARHEIKYRNMKPEALIKTIRKLHKLPMNAWRGFWATRTDALRDVVMVIDESHNAAGQYSMTGQVVREMTERADACIHSSATFAKDENNLALYSRVFPPQVSADEIADVVSNGGEPMREILTGMLAEDGLMIRREHDMGNIQFKPLIDEKRKARNLARKDAIADVLADMASVASSIKTLVEEKKANDKGRPIGDSMSFTTSYSGPFSRFYAISRVLSATLNVEHVSEIVDEVLAGNRKPVVTVENTMESVLRDIADGGKKDADGRIWLKTPATFKALLYRYMDNMFNVYEMTRKGRKVIHKKRIDIQTPEMKRAIEAIRKKIELLPDDLPLSPIDALREELESRGVRFGEISGRKIRLSHDENGRQFVEPVRDQKEGANARTISRFNAGEIDVILISNSGSTGISAHADSNFADTRQRILVELQPASDVRKRVQVYGRVFRSGQVCPPEYVLPSSGLYHEMRLAMIQNNASRRMSSSVSGSADNTLINKSVPEIMNPIGDQVCREWLESRPDLAQLMNIPVNDAVEDDDGSAVAGDDKEDGNCGTRFVDRLTGRLFMLRSDEEKAAWEEIHTEYLSRMELCIERGYNPLESSRKDLRAVKKKSATVAQSFDAAHTDSAFSRPVVAWEIEHQESLPALDPSTVLAEVKSGEALIERIETEGKGSLSELVKKAGQKLVAQVVKNTDFKSIEAAMADDKNNKVKAASLRASVVREALRKLGAPGTSIVSEFDSPDRRHASSGRYVVLRITPPADEAEYTRASMWKIRLLDIDKHRIVERRLATLAKGTLYTSSWSDKERDEQLKAALKRVSVPDIRVAQRVVLEGNLFEASCIAARLKAGEAVSYSDNRGMWRHAFMLPEGFELRDVLEMPIEMTSAEMAYEMLGAGDEGYPSILSNAFHASGQIYKVSLLDDGGIEITSPRPEGKKMIAKRTKVVRDEALKALSTEGAFSRSNPRKIVIAPHNAMAALGRLLNLGREIGEPVFAHARYRSWLAKHIESKKDVVSEVKDKARDMAKALAL